MRGHLPKIPPKGGNGFDNAVLARLLFRVNSKRLFQQVTELQGHLAALQETIREVAANRDLFASHVYHARRDYWYAVENDNKSGRKQEYAIRTTYLAATNLGFRGSPAEWLNVLRAWPSQNGARGTGD